MCAELGEVEANISAGDVVGGVAVITVLIALSPGSLSGSRSRQRCETGRGGLAQSICNLTNAFPPPHKLIVVNTCGISQHFSHGRFLYPFLYRDFVGL